MGLAWPYTQMGQARDRTYGLDRLAGGLVGSLFTSECRGGAGRGGATEGTRRVWAAATQAQALTGLPPVRRAS